MTRISTSRELDTATYDIPAGTSHPEFVVPTEVTDFIIKQYGLADPGMRVIDPFAGNGDFARRIISKGGHCDSIELDPEQYEIALSQLSGLLSIQESTAGNRTPGGEVVLGDCTRTVTPLMRLGYFAIYTSIPFTMIHDLARSRDRAVRRDERFAIALNMMLNSDGGVLIVDSAERAIRGGREYSPAADTIEYLVNPKSLYPYGYFNLVASHQFNIAQPPAGCDGQFTELVFAKRWPYYPGILKDLASVSW